MSVPKLRFKADDGSEFPACEEKCFGDIMTSLEYGMNAPAMRFDGIHKYLRITDIDDKSHRYLSDDVVSPSGDLNEKYLAEQGDIFFARTGASVGKTYLYDARDGELYFAGFLIRGKVKTSYNPYYIFTQTLTTQYSEWVKIMSTRSGQPGINANEYASYKFSCAPNICEQEKIADLFYTLDNAIEQTQSEIDAWEKQKRGVMQLLFSQKVRFKADDGSEFPAWEEKTLGECCECLDSMRIPVKKTDRNPGPYPYYGSTNIQDYVDSYLFDEPLVLLAEDAGPYDDFATKPIAQYVSGKCWVNNHAHVLKPKENVKYIFYSLEHKDIRMFINSPGRGKLNQEDMIKIIVPYPCLEEQQKIAACLSDFDTVIDKAKQELAAYRKLKKGLLQQMFV